LPDSRYIGKKYYLCHVEANIVILTECVRLRVERLGALLYIVGYLDNSSFFACERCKFGANNKIVFVII
ncbi:hypothetical protein K0G31_12640, partial [Bacteroides fragilis]|nr:hypothetical protein [Bacteroides fragilis]